MFSTLKVLSIKPGSGRGEFRGINLCFNAPIIRLLDDKILNFLFPNRNMLNSIFMLSFVKLKFIVGKFQNDLKILHSSFIGGSTSCMQELF
jgi:hypothetical protein